MPRPFEGIRILDLTHVLAGPFCSYQLALLGAETIKIEPPDEPDQVRESGTSKTLNRARMGTNYLSQSANKRTMTLDLKSQCGREVLRRMVGRSDVLIENYRAGSLASLGLGYSELSALKPNLIYCSMTGFGQNGPKGQVTAYDTVIQAASGLMSVSGTPEATPMKVGAPVLDYASGTMAAFAIASALYQRTHTGKGQYIDVSMLDTAMMLLSSSVTAYLYDGKQLSVPRGNDFSSANGCCYRTRDGRLLMLAAHNHRQHERLWTALGRPDIAKQSSYEQIEAINPLMKEELTRLFLTRTADEWQAFLAEHRVPAAKVLDVPEALADSQIKARDTLFHTFPAVDGVEGPVTVPVAAFRFAADGPRADTAPRPMGADNDAILAQFGYSSEEIASLRRLKIV